MVNSLPIRVLIAGGTTTDRDQVKQAIGLDKNFSIVPLETMRGAKVDADALVLIQDGSSTLDASLQGDSAVVSLPAIGAPAFVITRDEAGPSEMSGWSRLPQALRRAVANSQQDASSPSAVGGRTPDAGRMSDAGNDPVLAERAMRESQRLAAIGKLTAEIAHEINNPLESVGNLVYLAIREAGMPARAVEYLRTAERELARIVQISKQTLSFSRESTEPIPVRIPELMDEVVALYGRRIGQKKLTVIREYAAAEAVPGLPGELRQVFSNLVTNAIEATTAGGTLRLRIRAVLQRIGPIRHRGLRITVADTGAGIPEAARRKLGQMFFTTKGESGTGLGLWVTKSVIARYGGTLQLRSSTGSKHGTVFSIFLPFSDVDESSDRETNERFSHDNVTEISRHPKFTNHPPRGAETAVNFLKLNG